MHPNNWKAGLLNDRRDRVDRLYVNYSVNDVKNRFRNRKCDVLCNFPPTLSTVARLNVNEKEKNNEASLKFRHIHLSRTVYIS